VVSVDEEPYVLLQRRARRKEQLGGVIDVAVAGHQVSGDAPAEAVREAAEELSIWLDPGELTHVGTYERDAEGDSELVTVLVAIVPDVRKTARSVCCSPEVADILTVRLADLGSQEKIPAETLVNIGELRLPAREYIALAEFAPGLQDELALVATAVLPK
jgi:isopentenyldiphosphate isomerase